MLFLVVALSFLLKHAGQQSKSHRAHRYTCTTLLRHRSHRWFGRSLWKKSGCGWNSGTKKPGSAVSVLTSRFVSHASMLIISTLRPISAPWRDMSPLDFSHSPRKEMHLTPTYTCETVESKKMAATTTFLARSADSFRLCERRCSLLTTVEGANARVPWLSGTGAPLLGGTGAPLLRGAGGVPSPCSASLIGTQRRGDTEDPASAERASSPSSFGVPTTQATLPSSMRSGTRNKSSTIRSSVSLSKSASAVGRLAHRHEGAGSP